MTRPPVLAAVFVGGVLGALARTGLAQAWPVEPRALPWATFVSNVVGCALLGCVEQRTTEGTQRRALLAPGLCGALTTFSTLQFELVELLADGAPARAAAYVAASVVFGVAAYAGGRRVAG